MLMAVHEYERSKHEQHQAGRADEPDVDDLGGQSFRVVIFVGSLALRGYLEASVLVEKDKYNSDHHDDDHKHQRVEESAKELD